MYRRAAEVARHRATGHRVRSMVTVPVFCMPSAAVSVMKETRATFSALDAALAEMQRESVKEAKKKHSRRIEPAAAEVAVEEQVALEGLDVELGEGDTVVEKLPSLDMLADAKACIRHHLCCLSSTSCTVTPCTVVDVRQAAPKQRFDCCPCTAQADIYLIIVWRHGQFDSVTWCHGGVQQLQAGEQAAADDGLEALLESQPSTDNGAQPRIMVGVLAAFNRRPVDAEPLVASESGPLRRAVSYPDVYDVQVGLRAPSTAACWPRRWL